MNRSELMNRLERRYLRLCRNINELGRLDFKKAAPGTSPEDFVFSRIDFSRYREILEKDFDLLFLDGLADFDDAFLRKNFKLGREEIRSLIERSYKKIEGSYKLRQESPLILSIMRTLETSLEDLPLFSTEDIREHSETLYPLLLSSLDGVTVTHRDGKTTKLFLSAEGALSGTFQPGGKPWTRVLVPP